LAKQSEDASQTRRLMALAVVYDGEEPRLDAVLAEACRLVARQHTPGSLTNRSAQFNALNSSAHRSH
jgi:hypothetical protein